jgi:hypothetical protein
MRGGATTAIEKGRLRLRRQQRRQLGGAPRFLPDAQLDTRAGFFSPSLDGGLPLSTRKP